VLQLLLRLDRTGARLAYPAHGLVGIHAEFDEEAGRDRSRAPEPAAAVHEHATTFAQPAVQRRAAAAPGRLETLVGRAHVDDRQMVPLDSARDDLLAEARHAEQLELVALDQRDDGARAPSGNDVEVGGEVAFPTVVGQARPA